MSDSPDTLGWFLVAMVSEAGVMPLASTVEVT